MRLTRGVQMNTGGHDLGTHLGVISKLFIVAIMTDR